MRHGGRNNQVSTDWPRVREESNGKPRERGGGRSAWRLEHAICILNHPSKGPEMCVFVPCVCVCARVCAEMRQGKK